MPQPSLFLLDNASKRPMHALMIDFVLAHTDYGGLNMVDGNIVECLHVPFVGPNRHTTFAKTEYEISHILGAHFAFGNLQ